MPSKSRSRKLSIKYRFKKTLKRNTKKPLMRKSKINYSSNRWKNMKGGVIDPQQYRDESRNYDDDNSSSESEQSSSGQSSLKQSLSKRRKRRKLRIMPQGHSKQAAEPVGKARMLINKDRIHRQRKSSKKRNNDYNSSSESKQSKQSKIIKKEGLSAASLFMEHGSKNTKRAAKRNPYAAHIGINDKRLYLLYIIDEKNRGFTRNNGKPLLKKLELLKKEGLIDVDTKDEDEYDDRRLDDYHRYTKRNKEIIMEQIPEKVIDEVYRANLMEHNDNGMLGNFSKMQI